MASKKFLKTAERAGRKGRIETRGRISEEDAESLSGGGRKKGLKKKTRKAKNCQFEEKKNGTGHEQQTIDGARRVGAVPTRENPS